MSFLKRLSLGKLKTATAEHLQAFMDFLKKKDNPALLPMQIAYYTGLRIGEVCSLTCRTSTLTNSTSQYDAVCDTTGKGTRQR